MKESFGANFERELSCVKFLVPYRIPPNIKFELQKKSVIHSDDV